MQQESDGATALALGRAIRAAREARGLSTRELAGLVGTSQPFVSNLENGRIFPSLRTLSVLAEALGVPAETLLPAPARVEHRPAATGLRPRRGSEPATRLLVGGPASLLSGHRVQLVAGEAEPRPHLHDGEDFLRVLTGSVVLLREGTADVELRRDEWTSLDGRVPHRLRGGPDGGVALLVSPSSAAHEAA